MKQSYLIWILSLILLIPLTGCKTTDNGSPTLQSVLESYVSSTDLGKAIQSEEVFSKYHFPNSIGSFQLHQVRNYESQVPGSGISASYGSFSGDVITIFFYDRLERDIPNGADSELIKKEIEWSVFNLKRLGHQQVSEPTVTLVGEHPFLMTGAIGLSADRTLYDLSYVTGLHNAVFKMRISLNQFTKEACVEVLNSLLDDVNSKIIEPNLHPERFPTEGMMIIDSHKEYYQQVFSEDQSISPEEVSKIEKDNFNNPNDLISYKILSEVYYNSSEKVWSLVYGEAFVNNTDDAIAFEKISKAIYSIYVNGIEQIEDSKFSSSLSRHTVIDPEKIQSPFEVNFEVTTLMGLATLGSFEGFNIDTIYKMRNSQIDFWPEEIQKHVLIEYWEELRKLNLLEAYCYWLFRYSFPVEYADWEASNKHSIDAFLEWKKQNGSQLLASEVNRLLTSHKL